MNERACDSTLRPGLQADTGRPLAVPSPIEVAVLVIEQLTGWQRRLNDRQALRAMSPHLRRDAGLSDDDVAAEVAKPFWKP